MNFFSALLFLFFSVNAFGDIIFFDINNNPQEIEAARKAAVKRGEKLIVYPNFAPAVRAQMDRQADQLRALLNQYEGSTDALQRNSLADQYHALSAQMRQSNLGLKVNRNSTSDFIDQLAKDKVQVSSIIVSGHDGNGEFTGVNGSVLSRDLMAAFAKYPDLKNGVKSVFLAGCYTTKPGTLDYEWKPTFPNIEVINGYIDSAPLGDKPAGHDFIYNALSREKEILAAKSESQILASARSIIPSALGVNASICLKDGVYVDRAKYLNLEDAYKKCDILLEKREEVAESFRCYAEAKEGCEDPPEDTRGGLLRQYYNLIQDLQYCSFNPKYRSLAGQLPSGARMIRLIYYKNLRKNFATLYKEDIRASAAVLKKAGLSDEDVEKLLRIGSLSRKEAMELVQKIEALGRTTPPEEDAEKGIAVLASEKIGSSLRHYLLSLSEECVPFNWVEPSSREHSQCENMLSLGARAETLARQDYGAHLLRRRADNVRRKTLAYREETRSLVAKVEGHDPVTSNEAMDRKLVEARIAVFKAEEYKIYDEIDLFRAEHQISRFEERLRDPAVRADARLARRLDEDLVRSRVYRDELRGRVTSSLPLSEEFIASTSSRTSIESLRSNPERYFRLVSEALVLDEKRVERLESDLNYRVNHNLRENTVDDNYMQEGQMSEEERSTRRSQREQSLQRIRDELSDSKQMREFVDASRRALASGNQDQAAQEKVQEIIAQRTQRATRQRIRELERQILDNTRTIELYRRDLSRLPSDSSRRTEIQHIIGSGTNRRDQLQEELTRILQTVGNGGSQ